MNTPDHVITRDLFSFSDVIGVTRSRLLRLGRSLTRKWSGVFTYRWNLLQWVAVTWNGFLFPGLSHLCVRPPLVLVSDGKDGVSTLARLSHCMHSRVSTGLQQRWASWCLASFSLSKSGVSYVLIDGIIATRFPTIPPTSVKVIQRWWPGLLAGDCSRG